MPPGIIKVDCKQRSTAIRPRQESVHCTCCNNKFFHRICTSITQTAYRQRKASSSKVEFCCRECTAAPVAESTSQSGEVTRSEWSGDTVRVVRRPRCPVSVIPPLFLSFMAKRSLTYVSSHITIMRRK